MNVVYFDETDIGIPSDLIGVSEAAKLTGYNRQTLLSSKLPNIKIKDYCTIYKIKNKRTYCTFYSKSEILEFLAYDGREIATLFNRDKFYTYREIASLYNINFWRVYYIFFLIRKLNSMQLLHYLGNMKCYNFKTTHYIEKNSVDILFKALGYKKKE